MLSEAHWEARIWLEEADMLMEEVKYTTGEKLTTSRLEKGWCGGFSSCLPIFYGPRRNQIYFMQEYNPELGPMHRTIQHILNRFSSRDSHEDYNIHIIKYK